MQSSRMQDVDHGKSGLKNSKQDKPQGNSHMHREQTGLCLADLVLRTLNLGFRKKRKGKKVPIRIYYKRETRHCKIKRTAKAKQNP